MDELFDHPLHPYTRGLLRCLPSLDADKTERLFQIEGTVPLLNQIPSGCRFAPRCPCAREQCGTRMPELVLAGPSQKVRCHMAAEENGSRENRRVVEGWR